MKLFSTIIDRPLQYIHIIIDMNSSLLQKIKTWSSKLSIYRYCPITPIIIINYHHHHHLSPHAVSVGASPSL